MINYPCPNCPKQTVEDEEVTYMVRGPIEFALTYGQDRLTGSFHPIDPETLFDDLYNIEDKNSIEFYMNIIEKYDPKKEFFDYLGRNMWHSITIKNDIKLLSALFEKKVPFQPTDHSLNLLQYCILKE